MLYLSLNYAYVILSNLLVGLLKELFCPLFVTWLQFNITRSDLSVTRVVMTWQYTAKGCCWPSWPTGQLRCSSVMCCFLHLYRNISIAVDKGHSHSSVLKEKQNKKTLHASFWVTPAALHWEFCVNVKRTTETAFIWCCVTLCLCQFRLKWLLCRKKWSHIIRLSSSISEALRWEKTPGALLCYDFYGWGSWQGSATGSDVWPRWPCEASQSPTPDVG